MCPLAGRPGARQIAQGAQYRAQVVDPDGEVAVGIAEAFLVDRQRPLAGRPGAPQIALGRQHPAQVVDVDASWG